MIALFLAPIYLILNFYLSLRIYKWLCTVIPRFSYKGFRITYIVIYLFFVLSFTIAFLLPPGALQRIMKLIGNYWLGVLAYMAMTILIVDFIGLLIRKFTKYKDIAPSKKVFQRIGALCLVVIVSVSTFGIWNARQIYTTKYRVNVEKKAGNLKKLNIMLIADLHLGYNIGCGRMKDMVSKINKENSDIVLIAGDIFDNEYEALDDPEQLISILKSIKSKYGVYAVYGNHDIQEKILAGFTFPSKKKKVSSLKMDELLQKANIKLLKDEYELIDNSFYIYGRPDYERINRGITQRKTEKEVVDSIPDQTKPIIVVDHEPRNAARLSNAGADVMLCGHTHDGQLFPGNVTMKMIWDNPYGYKAYGDMDQVVTSGVGLFGPNMRVGTIAEICPIEVTFNE